MSKILLADLHNYNLPGIAEKLDKNYYEVIEGYCKNIEQSTANIQEAENEHASITLYVSLCVKLIEKIRNHMQMRKLITMPYLYELHDKVSTGHDCSECENGCQVGHNMKISGIKDTNQHIKEIFYRLQMVASPLYAENTPTDIYKALRNEIVMIDTKLTELFYLEEAVLLPKIIEAQKQIHVRS